MSAALGLPPSVRLRRAADFAALRHAPGRLDTRFFLIRYRASEVDSARLGLAVSRRVSKRAVDRNRIKRNARESFRRARVRVPAFDLLLIARQQAVTATGPALRADLDAAWSRLKPLKHARVPGTIAD
ncbi:MAG TPA: ribonuclease P protein component [Rhodanobacteraceae bacterium]|nr:ribonuclease P protein component [Rhodanobacteraceae bacterium]